MLLTFYRTLERPKKNVNVLAFSLQGGVQKSVAGLLSWAPIQFTSFANKSQKKCRLMADSWGGGSRQNPGGLVECEKSSIARILHQTFTWPFSSVRVLHLFFLWLFKLANAATHSAYVLFLNLVGKTFFYQGVVQKIRGQDEVGSQVNVHVTKSKNGEPVSLRFYLNSRHSNLLQGGSIEV